MNNPNPSIGFREVNLNGVGDATAVAAPHAVSAAALATVVYDNGAKTLTASGNGALTVDGVAVADTNTVVIKDQVAGLENGIYTVTDKGSAGTPFVLTRNGTYDTSGEIITGIGDRFQAAAGTVNSGHVFVYAFGGTQAMGTDALTFTDEGVANDLYVSDSIDVRGALRGRVRVPSAWTASDITFRAREKATVFGEGNRIYRTKDWVPLYDASGVLVRIEVDNADGWYTIPADVFAGAYVQIVTTADGSTARVHQADDRTLVVDFKSA